MTGFLTLFKKEVLRFWKVGLQTVAAPMLTALLYQLIFSHALGRHVEALPNVAYNAFLIPGLAMMSMAQNAFANASSSLIQSRLTQQPFLLQAVPAITAQRRVRALCRLRKVLLRQHRMS